jgi:hypothetical protein
MANDYGVMAAALKRRRGKSVDLDGVLKDDQQKKESKQSLDADGADGMSPGGINKVTAQAPVDAASEKQWNESQSPITSDSPKPVAQENINTLDPDESGEALDGQVYDDMVDHKRLDYLESRGINSPKTLWDKVQLQAKGKRKRGRG